MNFPRCETIDAVQDALAQDAEDADWTVEEEDEGIGPYEHFGQCGVDVAWVRRVEGSGGLAVVVPAGMDAAVETTVDVGGVEVSVVATEADRYPVPDEEGWEVVELAWYGEGSRGLSRAELREEYDEDAYERDRDEREGR